MVLNDNNERGRRAKSSGGVAGKRGKKKNGNIKPILIEITNLDRKCLGRKRAFGEEDEPSQGNCKKLKSLISEPCTTIIPTVEAAEQPCRD